MPDSSGNQFQVSEKSGRDGMPWIQTFTGRKFYPFDPRPEELDIRDIAHALSNICRYGGHSRKFYSVAEHSAMASYIVPPEDALWALMHDAAEAYIGDVVRPIKHSLGLEAFGVAEERLMDVICPWVGLEREQPASVTHADAVLLATEKRDLLCKPQAPMGETEWLHGAPVAAPLESVIAWTRTPAEAEDLFLFRFEMLAPELVV